MRNMKTLFIIDVQKEYMEKYEDTLLAKINERIQQAEANKEIVIYVKNIRNLRSGKTSYEFADGLTICSSYIFYKERASVFTNQELLNLLQENKIAEVEVIGIDGNCCVASSALAASDLGYQVTLPCRYIGVQNTERFEKKKILLKKKGIVLIVS